MKTFFGIALVAIAALCGRSAKADVTLAACAHEQICTEMFIPVGGLRQWISISGADRSNPIILVVHGGPGEAQWPEADRYRPWEQSFTVVQWDQRGAGHTYGLYGTKTPEVRLERMAKDGVAVAEYLRQTLHKRKIIVLGHSWGSAIAIRMVQLRPDLFAAYVGTGQVSNWKATVYLQFHLLLSAAQHEGDRAEVRRLEAIGQPDPRNAAQYFSFAGGLYKVMAPSDQAWLTSLRASVPLLAASYPKEVTALGDGMVFTSRQVWADQSTEDLPRTARQIDTAFFVIEGQDDFVTPTKLAVEYFNDVTAPKKELILIPDAGHFAFMTRPQLFLSTLVNKVRPVATARGA